MVCVDNTVTDLVAGYDRIVAGEKKVAERAAFRRKAAQQQQEQRAQAARAAWEARRRRLTPLIVLSAAAVVGLAALVALAGLFLVPLWLVPPDSPRLAEIYGLIVVALLIISVVVDNFRLTFDYLRDAFARSFGYYRFIAAWIAQFGILAKLQEIVALLSA